ncbi:hypothetical protein PIB30_041780 [Stylosanthes scabra]|uniref:Uncharacterized protein n=1 Tax=Stylosanthes scabra TaxID=79078 RepID=A0ABU6UDN1_9FABA|nr:hypothetical protein [Stylosanthes scabra]
MESFTLPKPCSSIQCISINEFSDAYYGYEDPPPPYPHSPSNFEDILQVLLQERKEFWENQKRIKAQLTTLTELVHEYLEEVEEENVDQEMADKDKESKGMEIIQSAEMDSLGMYESRFINYGESEFKAYNVHLHKLHNNRAKVGALNSRKHLGPWQSQEKLVDSQRNGWTNQV